MSGSEEVEEFLQSEPTQTYLNDRGETVAWPLVRLLAVEPCGTPGDGDEIIGFIAELPEIAAWVRGDV